MVCFRSFGCLEHPESWWCVGGEVTDFLGRRVTCPMSLWPELLVLAARRVHTGSSPVSAAAQTGQCVLLDGGRKTETRLSHPVSRGDSRRLTANILNDLLRLGSECRHQPRRPRLQVTWPLGDGPERPEPWPSPWVLSLGDSPHRVTRN